MSRLETELITRIEELQSEMNEQARLLGMSAERELKLIAEIEQARRTAEYWKAEHLAANAEIERLRADIEVREDGAEKMALKGIEMRNEIQRLISERNAFGLAIDRAISGIVPDEHPLRSRLVEIAAMRAQPAPSAQDGWQPIETAPKDGTHVLLANKSGTRVADGMYGNYKVWSWPYVLVEPAYWRPMPAAPSAQSAPSVPDDNAAFEAWFRSEQGTPYDGMWSFARAAWMARARLAPSAQEAI